MKSGSSSSCLGTAFLLVVTLVLIRYALPAVWKILTGIFAGAIYLSLGLFLLLLAVVGYFTYKNLTRNKEKAEQIQYARVTRVEELYKSLVDRLNLQMAMHQISPEELLQSEILIKDHLAAIRNDLIRLKDFASPKESENLSGPGIISNRITFHFPPLSRSTSVVNVPKL